LVPRIRSWRARHASLPQTFLKKSRGYWYLEVNRRQINLGPDREEAFYQWQKKHYPNVDTKILREFHIDEWLLTMNGLSTGSKRNYCRAIKAALRWAKRKGADRLQSDRGDGASQGR
jgi:hypothetical protein